MKHPKSTAAIVAAITSLTFAGVAGAQDCAEKATRLKTAVDAQAPSDTQATLSQALGIAIGANDTRCAEIVAQVEDQLKTAGEGHASADKPVPNYQNTPADPATGPGMSDTAVGADDEEGHASENDPIPNQPSGDAPAATGPGGTDSTSDSVVDEGATGHASGDDPIPNQSANSDDDSDAADED
jgi:hypothetical protein